IGFETGVIAVDAFIKADQGPFRIRFTAGQRFKRVANAVCLTREPAPEPPRARIDLMPAEHDRCTPPTRRCSQIPLDVWTIRAKKFDRTVSRTSPKCAD